MNPGLNFKNLNSLLTQFKPKNIVFPKSMVIKEDDKKYRRCQGVLNPDIVDTKMIYIEAGERKKIKLGSSEEGQFCYEGTIDSKLAASIQLRPVTDDLMAERFEGVGLTF
jgi:hypothetical protein